MTQEVSAQQAQEETIKTSLRIDTKVFWAIKHLALDQRKSIAKLSDEAFRDLLKKHGYSQHC
jgi:hypothetical protein